jgi:hypothetical protein
MLFVQSGTFQPDYSRLDQTPFTHEAMGTLTAVVVGAGALGNETIRQLGLLGAGKVTVIDPDFVEPSNLPRSLLFNYKRESKLGRNKAESAIESTSELFPDNDWSALPLEIADVGFQHLIHSDLLFSCTDSDLARLETAYISKALGIPMVDGGLGQQNYSHGRVTYFGAVAAVACFGCMLSPSKRAELLQTWQATTRPCSDNDSGMNGEFVSTSMMASIVAAIQVEFGLRNVLARDPSRPDICWTRSAIAQPCCVPRARVRKMSRSRVPCGISMRRVRWFGMVPLALLQKTLTQVL